MRSEIKSGSETRSKSKSKYTAAHYRRLRVQHSACVILRCVLVLTLVLFAWITDIGCALGWIRNANAGENWPPHFVQYGQMLIGASVLLTIAAVLIFLRRNWIALISASVGIVLCLVSVFRVTAYAADSGFYSRLMDMPVDTLYRLEILPTLVPYACIAALSLIQFFSVEEQEKRREKKRRENEEAPPIL